MSLSAVFIFMFAGVPVLALLVLLVRMVIVAIRKDSSLNDLLLGFMLLTVILVWMAWLSWWMWRGQAVLGQLAGGTS
ncbi:MAG: hypothetical protein ACKVW3_13100 [Phycisphaerales bacterium]